MHEHLPAAARLQRLRPAAVCVPALQLQPPFPAPGQLPPRLLRSASPPAPLPRAASPPARTAAASVPPFSLHVVHPLLAPWPHLSLLPSVCAPSLPAS
eukprot:192573-Prymnesium_polylepis.1